MAGRLGRPRARAPAAGLLSVEPVLAPRRHARLLRRPGRLRAGGAARIGRRGGGVSLRPALPVRLRAGVRRRLSAGARARAGAGGSGGRRGGVRVRALPTGAGRPHAGHLQRRDPAGLRPRPARLPPSPAGVGGRGMGGRRLAALGGLHARPAARLPAGHDLGDRRGRLAPNGATPPRPGAGDRHRRRRDDLRRRRAPAQPPVRPGGGRAPGGASNACGRGRVLGPAVDPLGRARREPGLGRRHVAASGRAGERPGEDPVPGPRDPRPGDRRALLARLSALVAPRVSGWAW